MRLKKWLIGWSIAGLAAPLLYFVVYFSTGYELFIFPLWPGSIGGMALENRPPLSTVLLVHLICIASNALLYGVIGLLLWPFTLVKSKGLSSEEGSRDQGESRK